jgi:lysophospholipase L1-like esterase
MKQYLQNRAAVFFAVLFCILNIACVKTSNSFITPITVGTTNDTITKRILALGDSYTIGQAVNEPDRFAAQTRLFLVQQNLRFAPVQYIATTGWTTLNLQAAITTQNPQGPFDLVTLLIGVNDQFQTRDTTNYRSRFTTLLAKAIELTGNRKERVFVLSIPDYSVTQIVSPPNKAQVSREIDWFNAINKNVTLGFGVNYTDITPSTREAAINPALISSDGLHPSGLEYKKWAEFLAPKMLAVVR